MRFRPLSIYLYTFLNVFLIFLANNYFAYLILFLISIIWVMYLKIKIKFSYFLFGSYISIFIFMFNIIIYQNFTTSLDEAVKSMSTFILILLYSFLLKKLVTSKELAYLFASTFSMFKIFGYNKNKIYTLFLIILNQINNLVISAKRLFNFSIIDSGLSKYKIIIKILIPFIFVSLKRNTNMTIALMLKGYNVDNKAIYYKSNVKYLYRYDILIILISIISIISVGGK